MKKSILLILLSIMCSLSTNSYSQTPNIELDSGDGTIISSKTSESAEFLFQTFEIEVPESGKYYLSAWVKGALTPIGEKLEYSFKVNDNEAEQNIKAEKSWSHALSFEDKKFVLHSGINIVTIKTRKPDYPNVEFIKVSLDKEKSRISSELYDSYLVDLSNNVLPDNYEELKAEEFANRECPNNSKGVDDFPLGGLYRYFENLTACYAEYSITIPENYKGSCLAKLMIDKNVNVKFLFVE